MTLWENPESQSFRSYVWQLFANNFWLKVLSLVFSVILFLSVRTEQVKEFTKVAKVSIITNERMMVIGPQERAVYVTVKLPNSLFVKAPDERELHGELDLRAEHVGKVRVRLTQDNFPALDKDKRYSLIIHDPTLEVELDNVVKKDLDIRVPIEGQPREGYVVERVLVTPERVSVTGAQRELQKMASLSTSVINIDGIDKSFSLRTKILTDDNSSVKLKDDWVNVQVVTGPQSLLRRFQRIPVETIGGIAVEVRPTHVDVELAGEKKVLDSLRASDIRIFVDVRKLQSTWQERVLRVEIPRDSSLARITPGSVRVRPAR